MEEYLGGLISCGFIINGYMECQREDITELMFMVREHNTTGDGSLIDLKNRGV
jgi:hypothetical protein